MDELSTKWQDLSDISQASIVELMAGKHQGNVFSSLMENFDIARQVIEASTDATGSALNEHSKYMDSMEGKLQQLSAAWQSFSQTFMNSEFPKGVIDVLRILLDLLDKLVGTFGTLGTIGIGTGATGIFKYFKNIDKYASVANEITDVVENTVDAIDLLNDIDLDDFDNSTDLLRALQPAATGSAEAIGEVVEAADNGTVAVGNLGTSVSGTTGSFKAFMKTPLGVASAIGVLVAAIGLAYNAFKKYKEEQAEARRETIETSDEFLTAANSFEQAYIKYSSRTDLTADEESELTSAIDGTVTALDDKSSALQGVVDASNDYVDSLERIAQEELKAQNRAAQDKLKAAKEELEEAVVGWTSLDGSEVNVDIYTGTNAYDQKVVELARKVDPEGKYINYSGNGNPNLKSGDIDFKISPNASIEEMISYYNMLVDYRDLLYELQEENPDDLSIGSAIDSTTTAIDQMTDAVNTYIDALYDASRLEYEYTQGNGIPKTVEEYLAMRENILNSLGDAGVKTKKQIANALDSDYGSSFDLSSIEVQARSLIGILDEFGETEAGQMETFLNMKTAVNNNECTVGEYLSQFDKIEKMTDGWSDEAKEELNLQFGLDADSIKQQYDEAYKYISRNYIDKIKASDLIRPGDIEEYKNIESERLESWLQGLTASELSALVSIEPEINWEDGDFDAALEQIQKEVELQEAMNFTIGIEVESEGIESLNTALAESASASGLSSESIEALKSRYADLESQGYDLSSMFEETANGIHLNRKAVSELEQAYASQKLSEADSNLKTLSDEYNNLGQQIRNCTDPAEKANLILERQNLAGKISEIATLASEYEGLTSAYKAWQDTESAGNERDMYESIIEGFETVEDEISRGWYDDGTIKFLELLTGQTDLASKSGKELKEIWNGLDNTIGDSGYSIRDFFTVNDDGESTNTGVYNFLRTVESFEDELGDVVKRDGDNNIIGFDFQVAGGDKVIADTLGISEELVQIMVRAADDAGFVVSLDGTYRQFADMEKEAKASVDYINELFDKNYSFDFSTTNIDSLTKQLEEARKILDNPNFWNKDGTFNFNADGATEAMNIVSTLQARLDTLTQEQYGIGLTVEEEKFEEPLEKLQEYGHTIATLNQLKLNPKTNADDIEKLEGDLEEISKYFAGLDGDLKVELGFEADDNWEEVQKKIESGEVTIPTVLDIQANMDKNIETLADLALLESGLLSSEEEETIRKKYNIEVETEVDNVDTDNVDEAIDSALSGENKTGKEIKKKATVVVDADTVDTSDVDKEVDGTLNNPPTGANGRKMGIGIDVNVDADNVDTDNVETSINEALEGSKLGVTQKLKIEAVAQVFGVDSVEELEERLNSLDDEQVQVLATVLGKVDVEQLQTVINGLDDKTVQAIAEAFGKGDVEGLKTVINGLDDKTVQAIAEAFGYNEVSELNAAIDNLNSKTVQAIAKALGITDVNSLREAIKRLKDKDVKAVAQVSGKSAVDNLKSAISSLKSKTVTITSIMKNIVSGGSVRQIVDGTANANGTAFTSGTTGKAFKQGDWGTKKTETALVGELGRRYCDHT